MIYTFVSMLTILYFIYYRYSYFKNWDSVTKRECSIISRTKTYIADEVVLGDNTGLPNFAYLITKGTCCVIEHLQVSILKYVFFYFRVIFLDVSPLIYVKTIC